MIPLTGKVPATYRCAMTGLEGSLPEWIRRTSAGIRDDGQAAILASLEREKKGTIDSVPASCAPQTHFERLGLAGWVLPVLMVFAMSGAARGQFKYTNDNGQITITQYTGPGGIVIIPETID